MPGKDLKVTIDADAAKLEREVKRAARSMEQLEREIAKGNREADKFAEQLNQKTAKALEHVGRGMVVFGAATLAGLGLATKAALDWETAWTGVLKTVDGTPEQLAAVEQGLRNLATELPASHQQIAAVAEAAGQLGIATPDVVAFTRVMVNLGETTNLTAEEAATAIAQLMNVMQTAPEDVGRLGAALVELGNNGASTERDIIEMAQRISGAGAIIGLSEAEVLALSNALASVGIPAEAGGSAISTAMIKMASAVAEGGEAVSGFAEAAGVSAAEFAQAFEQDPARAIQMFVEGLGRIDAAGGNVFAVLDDLGLGSIRTRDSLLRLAGSGDLLATSFEDGNRAWEENTALIEEAEKRYDTAEAKIAIARNTLVDLAIDIGGVILPAVSGLAEGAASLLKAFGDLPGPIKDVATVLAGLVGVASLAGGGLLLLAPKIAAARTEMQLLSATRPGVHRTLGLLGRAAGVATGLLVLATVLSQVNKGSRETAVGVGEATKELLGLRDGVSSDLITRIAEANRLLNDTANVDVPGIGNVSLSFTTMSGAVRDAAGDVEAGLGAIDQGLASLVGSGQADIAAESFKILAAQWVAGGGDVEELRKRLPGYRDALADVDNQQQLTAESIDPIDQGLAELAARFGLTGEDAAKAAQEMLDAWSEAASEFGSFTGAYDTALSAKEERERKTAEETAAATADQSDSWEDFLGDVTLTVDEYIAELERQVQAQEEWENNLLTIAGRVPPAMLDELARLGPAGAEEVALFAQMTDEELERAVAAWTTSTGEGADAIVGRLAEAAPVLEDIAAQMGEDVAQAIRAEMIANGGSVSEAAERLGVRIDKGVGTDRTRTARIEARARNIATTREELDSLTRGRTVWITPRIAGGVGSFRGGITDRGHSGGMVTGAGIIPRFHDGASLGRLAGDEIPAILQTRERVLSRAQNEAFETLMNTLGQAVPVTGGNQMGRGGGGGPTVIELRSGGSRLDDLLVDVLRNSIAVKGGDVQVVLGRST